MLRPLICLALTCLSSVTFSQARPQEGLVLEITEGNPVDLGLAWDTRSGVKIQQYCIDFKTISRNYQTKRLSFQLVEDNASLARALNVSVTGKVKGISGGFSANASFAHKSNFESSATQISVQADVSAAPSYVAPTTGQEPDVSKLGNPSQSDLVDLSLFYRGDSVKLKEDLWKLAASDPEDFFRRCGDSFVAVIHSGARINGLMKFKETTAEEKEAIALAAEGSGALWSASGSLDSKMESYHKNNKFNVDFVQEGGSKRPFPMSKEGLIEAIRDLPADAAAYPMPFTMVVQRYDTLPDWPKPPLNRDLSDQEVVADVYWRLRTMQTYADEILYKPGWLLKFDTPRNAVKKLNDEILVEIQQLRTFAKTCTSTVPCDVEPWRNWSDMKYRSRFPFRGTLADIPYGKDINDINNLPEKLAEARIKYWIEDHVRWRCKYEQVCTSQSDIDALRTQIQDRIATAIGMQK